VGRDQSPTPPNELGLCTSKVEAHTRITSSWCRAPAGPAYAEYVPPAATTTTTTTTTSAATAAPARPLAAEACAKRGRMTVYRGPVLGYEDAHVGACNATLAGSATHALVAVSTAHLSSRQGAWEPEPGACGSCLCMRVAGADVGMNAPAAAMYGPSLAATAGASFMGVVGDRCGECDDEHVDVLLDRPFSFAPYDKANPDGQDQAAAYAFALKPGNNAGGGGASSGPPVRPTNRRAPLVNRLRGPRVFGAADSLRGAGRGAPESVGVYVADWQWAPCGWTHGECAAMWRRLGYAAGSGPRGAWAPPVRSGVDSDTGGDVASPAQDRSFCCGAAEPAVEVPEVSDALPEAARAAVAARLAAAGGADAAMAAEQAAAAAEALLAGSGGGGGGAGALATASAGANATTGNARGEDQGAEPMYDAGTEFAASMALGGGGAPAASLLAARSIRASSSSSSSSSSLAAARAAGAASAGAKAGGGGGGGGAAGVIAGAVVGAALGAAAIGAVARAVVLRRRAAAAAQAAAAGEWGNGATAPGLARDAKQPVAAFVTPSAFRMPAPPASGNGAEMGR
jgi:hypothetical protein